MRAGCLLLLGTPLAAIAGLTVLVLLATGGPAPLPAQVAGIPAVLLTAYGQAVAAVGELVPGCRGMRWQILAAIAQVESAQAAGRTISADGTITPAIYGPALDGSGSGGNTTAHRDGAGGYVRALGPFQFLPTTWAELGQDGNGDGRRDPHNAVDAALAAAVYLCRTGADLGSAPGLRTAVFAYNHSHVYVADVTEWIRRLDALATTAGVQVAGALRTVIEAARAHLGWPYSWGGGTAAGPSRGICCSPGGQDGRTITGFDCSGLTLYAFARIGIALPRLAAAQARSGTRIPRTAGLAALRPGDLVFFAYVPEVDSTIHHVGIYLGNGQMINAPRPGLPVRTEPVWTRGYAGGARVRS